MWDALGRQGSSNFQWWLGEVILAAFATPLMLFLGYRWIAVVLGIVGVLALIVVILGARTMMRPGWPHD